MDVPKVASLAKTFLGKVSAAHLRRGMAAVGFCVHHLAAPLDHGGAVRQVGEEEGWPVAQNIVVTELQPPIALLWVLRNSKFTGEFRR